MTKSTDSGQGGARRGRCGHAAALLAGLAHALLMALAFDPLGVWIVALVAVAPLAWVVLTTSLPAWRAGLMVSLGVLPWWAYASHWVFGVSEAGAPPMVLYLTAYTWLFVAGGVRAVRAVPRLSAVVVLTVLWAGVEVLRGRVVFTGYPWYLVGHPLIEAPGAALAWPAAYVGAYGVSLLAALAGCAVGVVLAGRRLGRALWPVAVVLAAWPLAGLVPWVHPRAGGESITLAAVQTDIPQEVRWVWPPEERVRDLMELQALTRFAAASGADVVAWPEALAPSSALDPQAVRAEIEADVVWRLELPDGRAEYISPVVLTDAILDLQEEVGVPLLVGATGYEGLRIVVRDGRLRYDADSKHNSVFLIDGGRVRGERYDKLLLTPFGETMPLISSWPWLEARLLAIGAQGMTFEFEPGARAVRLRVRAASLGREVAVAAPICFEATLSYVCRRLVFEGGERRAGVMVNLTNDGWFRHWDAGRRHHELAARWRCVELATPMVRVANTGVSGGIDVRGRVVDAPLVHPEEGARAGRARASGVVLVTLALGEGTTVFARTGDVAAWLVLAGAAAIGGAGVVSGRWRRKSAGLADHGGKDVVDGGVDRGEG